MDNAIPVVNQRRQYSRDELFQAHLGDKAIRFYAASPRVANQLAVEYLKPKKRERDNIVVTPARG